MQHFPADGHEAEDAAHHARQEEEEEECILIEMKVKGKRDRKARAAETETSPKSVKERSGWQVSQRVGRSLTRQLT